MKNRSLISYRDTTRLNLESLRELPLPSTMDNRPSDREWLRDYYEVSLQVRDYLALCARVVPNRTLEMNRQAVLIGHMVRLFKLYDTFLLLVSAGRSEIAWMFHRFIVETGINLLFLIRKGTESIFESYVRSSLAYEKKLLEKADEYTRTPFVRGEDFQALRNEIAEDFARAGMSLDEVTSGKREREWGGKEYDNIYKRAAAIGGELEYEFPLRYGSRMAHGTWFELEHFHLLRKQNEFSPNASYKQPSSEILPGLAHYCIGVAVEYVIFMWNSKKNPLVKRLAAISGWFGEMREAFDRSMSRARKRKVH